MLTPEVLAGVFLDERGSRDRPTREVLAGAFLYERGEGQTRPERSG